MSVVDNPYIVKGGTNEVDVQGGQIKCVSCGSYFKRPSSHWSQTSCEPPVISYRIWKMVEGLMIGDGSLGNRHGKNCSIEIHNTNVTFLKYLQDQFGWLASSLSQQSTAHEIANNLNRRSCDDVTDPSDIHDQYLLTLRTHAVFNQLETWLEDSEIIVPQIEFTPELLRMWYISDGYLSWNKSGNSIVRFTSANECKRPKNILQSFANIGLECEVQGELNFALSTSQTEHFFDYIGHDPVPGFEYKWAYEDRDRYDRLMKEGKEKHCTQTIE